jgi:thioester reductase-like protein
MSTVSMCGTTRLYSMYELQSTLRAQRNKNDLHAKVRAQNSRRAVRKVSDQFKYLENWPRASDVTWQPVRGDLTVRP